jgi:hypothetical protein
MSDSSTGHAKNGIILHLLGGFVYFTFPVITTLSSALVHTLLSQPWARQPHACLSGRRGERGSRKSLYSSLPGGNKDDRVQVWWCMSVIPALGRLRQQDGYIVRPSQNNKTTAEGK